MKSTTKAFILGHRNDNISSLALQAKKYPDVEMPIAIEQIAGWQKASAKLPTWARCDDIIYPHHLAMEQCSSEEAAQYKVVVAKRWMNEGQTDAGDRTFADLTGGLGVDFSFLSALFTRSIYMEQQHELCECARNNFKALNLKGVEIWEGDSLKLLEKLPHLQLLFIDPARRDSHGGRTFAIKDCTPDILPLLPQLLNTANVIMLKLSPMLDWHETKRIINDKAPNTVKEIHIFATANECKELLVVLSAQQTNASARLFCVNDNGTFITDEENEHSATPTPTISSTDEAMSATWLYEPNAAIMKGGCFSTLARKYEIKAISPNSHLFISNSHKQDFPGRTMHIIKTTTMNKRLLRTNLQDIRQANITVRNFPLTAAQLRQRLKMADGGKCYLFATTTADNTHIIFVCDKK